MFGYKGHDIGRQVAAIGKNTRGVGCAHFEKTKGRTSGIIDVLQVAGYK
jgi:hypothetical protein